MDKAKIEKNIDKALEVIKKSVPEAYSATFTVFQTTQNGLAIGIGFVGGISTRMLTETCVAIVQKIATDKKVHPVIVLLDITKTIMSRECQEQEGEDSQAEKKSDNTKDA